METQKRTLSIKLDAANNVKKQFLADIGKDVTRVGRSFLDYRKQQIQGEGEFSFYDTQRVKYHEYRSEFPELPSAILQNTLRWIDSRVKAHVQTCKKKHKLVKWPNIRRFPINIREQIFSLHEDDRHHDMWFRFSTTNLPLHLCDYHQNILDKTESYADSQIIKKNGEWLLQLVCNVEVQDGEELDDDKTLGVDLGIVNPIVCSDGKRIGNGKRICHKKKEFQKKRSSQQSSKKDIISKQYRWMTDKDHKLSRQLVDYAASQGTKVLALENLKGQHLSNKRWRPYKWAFAELKEFISYKAEALGMEVVYVDQAYTSQNCSCCGQKLRNDRRTRDVYECGFCGSRMDADVNAAKNIYALSGADGPPVTMAKSQGLGANPAF